MRIGFFGGTFNPVHYGHLRAAEEARTLLSLDAIQFLPSGNPPLKNADLADMHDRVALTKLAIAGNPTFSLCDIELQSAQKSFTVDTARALAERYPKDDLIFILGADAFLDLPNWYRPEELTALIDFAVVTRPGVAPEIVLQSPFLDECVSAEPQAWRLRGGRTAVFLEITPLGISSTQLRRLIREGKSIRYLVPDSVAAYIEKKLLYRE